MDGVSTPISTGNSQNKDEGKLRPRRWWVALILGLFFSSLGQLYAGAPLRAIIALAITIALIVPVAHLSLSLLSWSLPAFVGGCLVALLFALLVTFDGALVAKRRRNEPTGPLNRVWVYVVYALIVSLAFNYLVPRVADRLPLTRFRMPSASMAPTILLGDMVLADMRRSAVFPIRPGDIIVFRYPPEPETFYMKRVVGLPGQTIEVRGGLLVVDGQVRTQSSSVVTESFEGPSYTLRMSEREYFGPVVVPEGNYFVLGDNRDRSSDSRVWGTVPQELVEGIVYRVWFSMDPDSGGIRWDRVGKSLSLRDS